VTLAECAFDTGGSGVTASISAADARCSAPMNRVAALFGETASRIVVSAAPDNAEAVLGRARSAGVPARVIGQTGGTRITIDVDGVRAIDVPVADAERVWCSALERYFVKKVA